MVFRRQSTYIRRMPSSASQSGIYLLNLNTHEKLTLPGSGAFTHLGGRPTGTTLLP